LLGSGITEFTLPLLRRMNSKWIKLTT
jgi:hypothetical protein